MPDVGTTAQPVPDSHHRPGYVALVAGLRAEFSDLALEALWIQMRQHQYDRSSLGVLAQAVHDARDLTYDLDAQLHQAVKVWFANQTPGGAE